FEDVPTDDSEIDFEFSDEFNRKMEKLLKRVRYDSTHVVSWATKKIIVIAAALTLAIAGMMSVSAIREPIVEIIMEIYDGFVELFFEGDTTSKITYQYSLSEVPEGFVETQRISNNGVNIMEYKNKEDKIIQFVQSITEHNSTSLDNEHGYIEEYNIDGTQVRIYIDKLGGSYYAFWTKECYYMTLTFSGTTTINELIEIIKSIH
ncbi:MAG: DUF4367 domain-containing protein, partial [Clostridia bacterium]|nr:DUF4367 domain-containing protein [Clostridia bacterium]